MENHGGLFFTLFMGGLLGSVTHCTGMCGPFVMAQVGAAHKNTVNHNEGGGLARFRGAALLPYHMGRISTYIILGVLAAAFSGSLMGTPLERGMAFVFLSFAGLLFLASALPALKAQLPSVTGHRFIAAAGAAIGRAATPFMQSNSIGRRYILGLLLGMLPCGLVMAALMAVIATGDPVSAAFGMASFGAGTVPALVFIGTGTRLALKRWPQQVQLIASGMMVVNGISLMVLAGSVVM